MILVSDIENFIFSSLARLRFSLKVNTCLGARLETGKPTWECLKHIIHKDYLPASMGTRTFTTRLTMFKSNRQAFQNSYADNKPEQTKDKNGKYSA